MRYYKLLKPNEVIGAVTSNDFLAENPINGWLLASNEILGQFVSHKNKLYRDYWLQGISSNFYNYETVTIQEISEEEYNIIHQAEMNNETIIIDDDDDEPDKPIPTPPVDPDPDVTLEYVRESKVHEMSAACRNAIEDGVDVILRGETHHFSLTTQDQLNLMSLNTYMGTQNLIPYHADGEEVSFYTVDEIKEIIAAAMAHKSYHTTYFNALKSYINALDSIENIAAITYGTPIPDEYKSDVLRVLE